MAVIGKDSNRHPPAGEFHRVWGALGVNAAVGVLVVNGKIAAEAIPQDDLERGEGTGEAPGTTRATTLRAGAVH